MLAPELLEILVCPETRQNLELAGDDLVRRVNVAVAGGSLRSRGGDPVDEPVDGGLVREDGAYLYAIRGDPPIPIMLIDQAIPLEDLEG